jgi:hypothetical protein
VPRCPTFTATSAGGAWVEALDAEQRPPAVKEEVGGCPARWDEVWRLASRRGRP